MAVMATLCMAVTSCDDSRAVRLAQGDYSYKTSGTVLIGQETVALTDEQGQMEVISLQDGDSVILTMNALGGPAYSARGAIDREGNVTINPYFRQMEIRFDTTRLLSWPERELFDVIVSGHGRRYDNTIILELKLDGRSTESNHELHSDRVTTIAKRN